MKKTLLSTILLLSALSASSQISYEAPNDYGKLFNVTYDVTVSNKVYALTSNNHIVVSTNQGVTWTVLYSHPVGMAQMQLINNGTAFSLITDSDIIIYDIASNQVTASYPIPQSGVDGASASWVNTYHVHDENTIIVDTGFSVGFDNFSKVFYTNTAGTGWNEIYYTVDNLNIFPVDVAISPANPQKVFIARGGGNMGTQGGILISTDAGETYTESLGGTLFQNITFNPDNADEILLGTGIAFGASPEGVHKSVDGGATWTTLDMEFEEGILNYIPYIAYDPANTDNILVLEENEIFFSTDGGTTFTKQYYDINTQTDYYSGLFASFDPFDDNRIIITTDYFPQVTTNQGETLTQIKAPFYSTGALAVSKTGETPHLFYSHNGGYLHKDIASGVTTAYEVLPINMFTQTPTIVKPDPKVEGRSFIVLAGGFFFPGSINVSYDNGATYSLVMNASGNDMPAITVDPANDNIIYFSLRQSGNSVMFRVDLTDSENIIAEEILLPDQEVEEGQEAGVVTGILIDETGTITIAKLDKLYTSEDGGQNWTVLQTTGLSGFTRIWDLEQSNVNEDNLLLATDNGLFASVDGGATWTVTIPDTDIRQANFSPLDANVAVATQFTTITTNAQFFVTANGGTNWTGVTSQDILSSASASFDYAFTEDTVTAYIATPDIAVLSYVVDLDDVLGIEIPEALQGNALVLYPNPAASVLNVAVSGNVQVVSTSIYNLSGQKVIESQNPTINIDTLSNGVYIVKCTAANGSAYTQKLIKRG